LAPVKREKKQSTETTPFLSVFASARNTCPGGLPTRYNGDFKAERKRGALVYNQQWLHRIKGKQDEDSKRLTFFLGLGTQTRNQPDRLNMNIETQGVGIERTKYKQHRGEPRKTRVILNEWKFQKIH